MKTDLPIFMFQLSAIATAETERVAGSRHAMLGFVLDDKMEEAQRRLTEEILDIGWEKPEFVRVGQFDPGNERYDEVKPESESGIAIVIYNDPLE